MKEGHNYCSMTGKPVKLWLRTFVVRYKANVSLSLTMSRMREEIPSTVLCENKIVKITVFVDTKNVEVLTAPIALHSARKHTQTKKTERRERNQYGKERTETNANEQ